jgi:hypothetical protein
LLHGGLIVTSLASLSFLFGSLGCNSQGVLCWMLLLILLIDDVNNARVYRILLSLNIINTGLSKWKKAVLLYGNSAVYFLAVKHI